jgi:hypothetical protein
MTRKSLVALLALAPVLLTADEKAGCPMGPFTFTSAREQQAALFHQVSAVAEAVAPSARRRAVAPGTPGDGTFPLAANFIDTDLFNKMKSDGIVPTAVSSDEEFLRRVTLDLTGQIPDTATIQAFLADHSADKRAKKIDQLLASDVFVDRWTAWFGDLVQNVQVATNIREYYPGRNAYYKWIHDSIQQKKPYDQMARELIAATGDNSVSGPPNFWVRQIQPNGPIQDTYDNLAAQSGDRFLGMQLLCLSCHNGLGHLELVNQYLKKKSRYDFWKMAAFFAPGFTGKPTIYTDPNNPNAKLRKYNLTDNQALKYNLNTTDGNKSPRAPLSDGSTTASPAYMFTGEQPMPGELSRVAYGRMLTADRQFARAAVNYLWKEMYGMGLVEPDNTFDLARLDPNNLPAGQTVQPTNPQLLEDLTTEFILDKFDLRAILRTMATSSSYQLSSRYTPGAWNEAWTPYFARHYPHRLMAEMLLDEIVKATSVGVSFNVSGMGPVTAAMKLPDTTEPNARNVYGAFLNELGRGNRDDQMRSNDASISQSLSLMNDQTIVINRIHKSNAASTVSKILASTSDPASIADQLYLATLSRHPSASESAQAVAYLHSGTLSQKTEDLQWVLLNSLEFLLD